MIGRTRFAHPPNIPKYNLLHRHHLHLSQHRAQHLTRPRTELPRCCPRLPLPTFRRCNTSSNICNPIHIDNPHTTPTGITGTLINRIVDQGNLAPSTITTAHTTTDINNDLLPNSTDNHTTTTARHPLHKTSHGVHADHRATSDRATHLKGITRVDTDNSIIQFSRRVLRNRHHHIRVITMHIIHSNAHSICKATKLK